MSTGGGNSGFESFVDVVSQVFTLGAVGFKSDDKGNDDELGEGGFGLGWSTEFASDVIKEVSGAKAAEEANEDARARFEEEKVAATKARKDAQSQSAANQLNKSRSAASARGGVSSSTSGGIQTGFSGLGSDTSDFLGL